VAKSQNQTPALFDLGEPAAMTAPAIVTVDPGALTRLLTEYAEGKERRREVAMELWAHPESPLFDELMRALEAAEAHGQWKKEHF